MTQTPTRPVERRLFAARSATPGRRPLEDPRHTGAPYSGEWPPPEEPDLDPARVVLIDADPVSRHVFTGTLRRSREVELIGTWDSRLPVSDYPRHADLAILVSGPMENHVLLAQQFAQWGTKALMISIDWTRHTLAAALTSGISGCLSKGWAVGHLQGAAAATVSGHVVLSPDLVDLCVATKPIAGGQELRSLLRRLTGREREVLSLLAEGMSTGEASKSLVVSQATIKSHVSHALTKLGVRNRLEAVMLMQAALGCGIQASERGRDLAGSHAFGS